MRILFIAVLIGSSSVSAYAAQKSERGNAQLGFVFAKENCSRCHAIEKFGDSPLPVAPRFRDLHLRYLVEDLAEALGEGISTGHPTMPEFRLYPDQIENLIAYLKTLERGRSLELSPATINRNSYGYWKVRQRLPKPDDRSDPTL
jgi:mono/diheme cytochrome c family protein